MSCGCVFACVWYKSVIFLYSMGMSHDDDHAACTGHSHIMSGEWVKGRNPSDLSWSTCSRDDLENFLRWEVVITVIPPFCIIKQYCFTGTGKDLGKCTHELYVRVLSHMESLVPLNWNLACFPFYALLLDRWESSNHTWTRTTGSSEVVPARFQMNSSMVQLQWESNLSLNRPDCRTWAKKNSMYCGL